MRVTVLQLGDISADMTPNKALGELIKLVNNWYWLYTYISVVQSKI